MVNTAGNFLIMPNNPLQIHLKLLRAIQKRAETTENLIVHKITKKVRRIHERIIQIYLYKKNHRGKNHFPNPEISWKARKDLVNIIFPSKVWLKKDGFSHHWKFQTKKFLVISKCHLFITPLAQNQTIFPLPFPFPKHSKQENFRNLQISYYH